MRWSKCCIFFLVNVGNLKEGKNKNILNIQELWGIAINHAVCVKVFFLFYFLFQTLTELGLS